MHYPKKILKLLAAGMGFITFGLICNALVTTMNGGMPVLGLNYTVGKWLPMTPSTKLPFLGDVIFHWSIGDITMIAGYILAGVGLICLLLRRR